MLWPLSQCCYIVFADVDGVCVLQMKLPLFIFSLLALLESDLCRALVLVHQFVLSCHVVVFLAIYSFSNSCTPIQSVTQSAGQFGIDLVVGCNVGEGRVETRLTSFLSLMNSLKAAERHVPSLHKS